jgi:hypothetical protein
VLTQQHAAVAILDVGRMDDGLHQQALGYGTTIWMRERVNQDEKL